MRDAIVNAGQAGDTLGGVFEVIAYGFPAGVGSYVQGDLRLGARLAAAAMTIPAMKGVEIGDGFAVAADPGSRVHDEIVIVDGEYRRATNRAGGIEGGISTGEPIVVRIAMKPIATLLEPLQSVDLDTGEADGFTVRAQRCLRRAGGGGRRRGGRGAGSGRCRPRAVRRRDGDRAAGRRRGLSRAYRQAVKRRRRHGRVHGRR